MEELFLEVFQEIPRQGPGSNISTKRAIDLIKELPENPKILDLGCGTGSQTFQLAHHVGGAILALDIHKPYLKKLKQTADRLGYSDCITTVHGDMTNLPFPSSFFDLIWCEGAIYIIGFAEGLKSLRTILRPSGYLALTEINWLKTNPPEDLKSFWKQEYEGMTTVDANLKMIAEQGYQLIDYFILPPKAWWDNLYAPLENRLVGLRKKYLENEEALGLIEFVQLEIDMFRKYPDYYGYVFYIMQKL